MNFRHLSFHDRQHMEFMLRHGFDKKQIANELGCHISTVYRELKRGAYSHFYDKDVSCGYQQKYAAELAQRDYEWKAGSKGADLKIGTDVELSGLIADLIKRQHYSPYAVSEYLKRRGLTYLCESTIYRYVAMGVIPGVTIRNLPYGHHWKPSKSPVVRFHRPRANNIETRPASVAERNTFGNWEMDLVIGKKSGPGQAVLVLSERLTRYEVMVKLPDRSSDSVVRALHRLEHEYDFPRLFHTITVDNGSEFQDYKGIEHSRNGKRRTTVYYCHPYCSSERGTNENINRMIRRYFPKGSDFQPVTQGMCRGVMSWLNNYPRKVLGGRTAQECFEEQLSLLAAS